MRRAPKKIYSKKPGPVVLTVDPRLLQNGITLPKITYKILATVEEEEVYHGMMISLPRVLVYYLSRNELLVVTLILEHTKKHGECALTVKEIAALLVLSAPTVSNVLYSLRKIGILQEMPDGRRGAGKIRKLNYKAIQHLNDLCEGEDPGVFIRIRKATRKIDLNNLTKDDIKNAYDNTVLEPGHDPSQEEEYN